MLLSRSSNYWVYSALLSCTVLCSALLCFILLFSTSLCSAMRIVLCFWCGWPLNAIITPGYTKLDFESCHIKVGIPNWTALSQRCLSWCTCVSCVHKTHTHTHTKIHMYIEEVELRQSTCANPIKHSSYGAFICNCCRLLFNALGPGRLGDGRRRGVGGKGVAILGLQA